VLSNWEQLRRLGAGFWLRSTQVLASIAERLAKQQFAARRNADDCALLYCALGKRTVLQVRTGCPVPGHLCRALFLVAVCMGVRCRSSTWEKTENWTDWVPQAGRVGLKRWHTTHPLLQGLYRSTQNRKLSEFLARDFEQEQHRQAAQARRQQELRKAACPGLCSSHLPWIGVMLLCRLCCTRFCHRASVKSN